MEEVIQALDKHLYEHDLLESLNSVKEELEQHMEITLKLTEQMKPASKTSYLEVDNNALFKVQEERKALKEKEREERKKAEDEVNKLIKEEDDSRRQAEIEKRNKIGFSDDLGEPILEQVENDDSKMEVDDSGVHEETVVDNHEEVVAEENGLSSTSTSTRPTRASSPILIKKPDLPPGDYFKLGQEGTYKQYVNQYSAVPHALSRNQLKEETEKKTRLSHKFSLTDVSTYKWVGATEGSRQQLLTAVR